MHSLSAPILVIGYHGQVATSLRKIGGKDILAIGRPEIDLENLENFSHLLEKYQPKLIINAAAWTKVDLAETEQDAAKQANHIGPAIIATEAAKRQIPFLHISTDYVFNGVTNRPYLESDPISPVTIYGKTKADGEEAILKSHPQSAVFRTSWVYSPYGQNFVRTMMNAGAKNPVLRVVGDQKGNPTSAEDLATVLLAIAKKILSDGWRNHYHGLFHATGKGEASWYDLAQKTLEEAEKYGQKKPQIESILTKDWPTPAQRPADSRLNNEKLKEVFQQELPSWENSVARTVKTIFLIS